MHCYWALLSGELTTSVIRISIDTFKTHATHSSDADCWIEAAGPVSWSVLCSPTAISAAQSRRGASFTYVARMKVLFNTKYERCVSALLDTYLSDADCSRLKPEVDLSSVILDSGQTGQLLLHTSILLTCSGSWSDTYPQSVCSRSAPATFHLRVCSVDVAFDKFDILYYTSIYGYIHVYIIHIRGRSYIT